ncbi:MAG: GCN5-related N-acetyltransferase [Cytophagaceae bacterium]|jgi:GNAT superfamily N-acetyltransferase|nr:GCN5-related N-acetyltransferase [Cytophagaceae bacterium]
MSNIQYYRVKPEDHSILQQIAQWYHTEWNMDPASTRTRIADFPATGIPFHLFMTADGVPVATGGLAYHVSLMNEAPRLKIYSPWLALVHTAPEHQNKGYGTLLCQKIEEMANELGVKEYFLFTYTAEKLYTKLDWEVMERLEARGKQIVVMKKKID